MRLARRHAGALRHSRERHGSAAGRQRGEKMEPVSTDWMPRRCASECPFARAGTRGDGGVLPGSSDRFEPVLDVLVMPMSSMSVAVGPPLMRDEFHIYPTYCPLTNVLRYCTLDNALHIVELETPKEEQMAGSMDTHGLRIAIIGGGIGGLTLAIALRQRGMTAEVFEQAPELAEIGAAVALSANSTRELQRLGVLDGITAASTEPSELIYRGWRDDRRIAAFPVHKDLAYQKRFGAPYYGIHRADLQKVLSGALGGAGLHLGYRLVDLVDQGDTIRLEFANGRLDRSGSGDRGRRGPLPGPPIRYGGRGRDLLGHERLPRHRPRGSAALPARPESHSVLDGAGRPSAPLRDWQ